MYYNGTKLLSLKDANGKTPEIFICTTNRTGGKTTYFNRLMTNRFLKQNKKFMLLYRYNYEIKDAHENFFKDIHGLFFPDYEISSAFKEKKYSELFINRIENEKVLSCGYACALNDADFVKKHSHYFSDVDGILFDEFQSETNNYVDDEVTKFLSIYFSVARGQGKQHRYVPCYLVGNQVTILNPYYTRMKINERLNDKVNFLRGDGYVLENGFIESAGKALKESGVARAFSSENYVNYGSQKVYLNDNYAFIDTINGKGRYLCTLKYNGTLFALREYADEGLIYCNKHVDNTFPTKVSVTTEDHNINYVVLKSNAILINLLRYYFNHGCFRFKDLQCKEVVLKLLSYY